MPARQLRNYSEMFMEGEGGWRKPEFGGEDGTEVEEQWDLEPSLIHSPQNPEGGQGTLSLLSSSSPTEVTRHKRCRSRDGSPESQKGKGHGEEKVRGRPPPAQWRSKEHPNSCRAGLYHRAGKLLG